MLAYDSFQMNYHNMYPASTQPSPSSISLPPISSIDFRVQAAHHSPPEVVQPLPPPPPPPRHLPPLSYYNSGRQIPQEPQYVQQQAFYRNMQPPSPYNFGPGTRIPLPSTADPSLMVAPARHKTKEVKRRTKTGCLTCRKRRIKVRIIISLLCYSHFIFQRYQPCGQLWGQVYTGGALERHTAPAIDAFACLSHARTAPNAPLFSPHEKILPATTTLLHNRCCPSLLSAASLRLSLLASLLPNYLQLRDL